METGMYVIKRGYSGKRYEAGTGDIYLVEKVTAKMLVCSRLHYGGKQHIPKNAIVFTAPNHETAVDLVNKLAGIRGEMSRRVAAAKDAAEAAVDKLIAQHAAARAASSRTE